MPHVDVDRRMETPAFFAALLIEYQEKNRMTTERITEIRASRALQEKLIFHFEEKVNGAVECLVAATSPAEEASNGKAMDIDLFQALREKIRQTRTMLAEKTNETTSETISQDDEMGITRSFRSVP